MEHTDLLTLKALRYHAFHGVHAIEREQGNSFEVDVIFHAELRQAGAHDQLDLTVDYEKAEQIISGVMFGPSVHLIEKLCVDIGEQLMNTFLLVDAVQVVIRKLNPPITVPTAYSEISMQWQRSSK